MYIYPILNFIWAAFILLAICTFDAYVFLYDQVVRFNFQPHPNFSDLFIISDIAPSEEFYLIQKIGHMFSFGIMYVLQVLWLKRFGLAFVLTGIFAAFTEVLQLYFYRNGRLVDVAIDLIGISVAYFICKSHMSSEEVKSRQSYSYFRDI